MIDFSTLQELTIPEGVVTEIADAQGRVLWSYGSPAILEVEKQTLTTYAGETSYENESFVLLDIYPKNANSTVKVTYGGLTKTLEFSGTNAQQVYFGTFNGVSDSVETPTSGTLTIEGGCVGFACGTYTAISGKTNNAHCGCITNVNSWGIVDYIPHYAFNGCSNLALTELPSGITSIGNYAFNGCSNLALTELPSGITSIGNCAFTDCSNLALTELPSGITSIGNYAFYGCSNLALITIPNSVVSIGTKAFLKAPLKQITVLAETPPTMTEGVFSIGNGVPIIVPKGCGEIYKVAEGWSTYADYIVEASE